MEKIEIKAGPGATEIVVREGQAPTNPELPSGYEVAGDIGTPGRFYKAKNDTESRVTRFWPESHVIASYDDGTIKLVINEQSRAEKIIVSGGIVLDTALLGLRINTGATYSAKKLSELFRKNRLLFASSDENLDLVTAFSKFTATIYKRIEETETNYGDRKHLIEQHVENDMPQSFKLDCPIIKFGEKVSFEVDIFCDVTGDEAVFTLDSVQLHELAITATKELIDKELETFTADDFAIIYK